MHPKQTALAALVLGIMISPLNSVSAQSPPVSGQVEVQAATHKATSSIIEQPKMINHRDPFVKMAHTPPVPPLPPEIRKPENTKVEKFEHKNAVTICPELLAPQVKINGIISSTSGNRAILNSPNNTYVVQRGDKLGDYTVESVKPKSVVFRYKDQTFNLKLEDEFASVAAVPGKKR